jgi:hypothetical protein
MKKLFLRLTPVLLVGLLVPAGGCAKEPEKLPPGDPSKASPMDGPPGSTGKIPGPGGSGSGAPPGHGPGMPGGAK